MGYTTTFGTQSRPTRSLSAQVINGAFEDTTPRTMDQAIGSTLSKFENEQEKIERWLRQYGFEYNPFAYTDSERDAKLNEYFVEYADFEKTIGLNDRLVFAHPGAGKTAIRLRLQTFYRDSVADGGVFAFSYLIPQELAASPPSSIDGHLAEILTAAVRHAFVFLALRGVDLAPLQDAKLGQTVAAQFAAFFDEYYGILNSWQADLQQAIADFSLKQVLKNLEPVYDELEFSDLADTINIQWLQQWFAHLTSQPTEIPFRLPNNLWAQWQLFQHLLTSIGIKAMIILVDSSDVKPANQNRNQPGVSASAVNKSQIQRMVATVQPLIAALAERSLGNYIYWKLFLPLELCLPVIQLLPLALEYDIIEWSRVQLLQLLNSRLRAASNGAVTSINQLVANDVLLNLETYLCADCESSPRYLIHFVNKLFGAHVGCTNSGQLPGKISRQSLASLAYPVHRQTSRLVQP